MEKRRIYLGIFLWIIGECWAVSVLIVEVRHKNWLVVAILAVMAALIALGPFIRNIVSGGRGFF